MQKRNVLNSPRLTELKKRRRKIFVYKIFLSLFGLVVILAFFSYISRLPHLNITEIQIVDNKFIDGDEAQNVIWGEMAGKYLWLFPKTNVFFYPQNNIKRALQDKFKRIENINLSIKNNQILIVSLTEREAKYTWCGAEVSGVGIPQGSPTPETSKEKCYFVDKLGYIFEEAPHFSGEVYFKFFGTSKDFYFYRESFEKLVLFKNTLVNLKLKPVYLYVNTEKEVEVYLSKTNLSKYEHKIIFNLNADIQNVIENITAALNTEPLKTDIKNKYSSLQYIDLRFGNKVYTKF